MKEIGHKSNLFPQDYFYEGIWPFVFLPNGPPPSLPRLLLVFFFGGGWTITTFMTKFLHKSSRGKVSCLTTTFMKEIGHRSSLFPQDYFYEGNWS